MFRRPCFRTPSGGNFYVVIYALFWIPQRKRRNNMRYPLRYPLMFNDIIILSRRKNCNIFIIYIYILTARDKILSNSAPLLLLVCHIFFFFSKRVTKIGTVRKDNNMPPARKPGETRGATLWGSRASTIVWTARTTVLWRLVTVVAADDRFRNRFDRAHSNNKTFLGVGSPAAGKLGTGNVRLYAIRAAQRRLTGIRLPNAKICVRNACC